MPLDHPPEHPQALEWIGERSHALSRLRTFMSKVPRYAARRNYAVPGDDGVSRLSPYLRYRLISEEEVITQVTDALDFSVAEKFIQEVVWRTYWKGALHRNAELWYSYKARLGELLSEANIAPWGPLYQAAREGQTDLSYFNEWVDELTTTGYLHNHVRMWFASIWIFTFKIPWQLGAAFMYHHLLDGDPASNTLSWRWVAGLHTKGKTYLARPDNIAKYSEGRWTPREGELATEPFFISEEGPPSSSRGWRYSPSRDAGRSGLVVTTDDLSIETVLDTSRYAAVCLLEAGVTEVSSLKRGFVSQASQDLRARIAARRGGDAIPVVSPLSELSAWRESHNLDRVVIVEPQVGDLSTATHAITEAVISSGGVVEMLRRRWDIQLFPLCDKGFFTMWERYKKRFEGQDDLSGTVQLSLES